jgi:hypothetical protein
MFATEGMGGGGGIFRDLRVSALVPRVAFRRRFDAESRTAVGFVLNVGLGWPADFALETCATAVDATTRTAAAEVINNLGGFIGGHRPLRQQLRGKTDSK